VSTSQGAVNPQHYKSHPSGIECIEIRRHLTSNRADAIKYLWRLGKKDDSNQELQKAIWYLNDEFNYFAGIVEYTPFVTKLLYSKLDKLGLYQSEQQIELFNLIVFGDAKRLKRAIKIIEDMLDE